VAHQEDGTMFRYEGCDSVLNEKQRTDNG